MPSTHMQVYQSAIQNSAGDLGFKARRSCHVQPFLRALHWLPIRARIHNRHLCVTTSSLIRRIAACLSDILSAPLPCSFASLQTLTHFVSSVLKLKTFGQSSFCYSSYNTTIQQYSKTRYKNALLIFKNKIWLSAADKYLIKIMCFQVRSSLVTDPSKNS